MRPALVIRHSVNFVDDDRLHAAEMFPALPCGEKDVERFGCGDEDVRRVPQHRGALFGKRVSGPNSGANLGAQITSLHGQALNLSERTIKIFLHIIREGLKWTDIDDLRAGSELAGERSAQKLIDADEKSSKGLAASCRRGDKSGITRENTGPPIRLRLSGTAEFIEKPLRRNGVSPCQGCGDFNAFGGQGHAVF